MPAPFSQVNTGRLIATIRLGDRTPGNRLARERVAVQWHLDERGLLEEVDRG